MSAFGGKADINHGLAEGPLIAISGHSKDTRPILGGVCLMMKNRAEWASEHGQITKVWVSDGCGGETIPMTVRIGSCQSRFEGYLGNVS